MLLESIFDERRTYSIERVAALRDAIQGLAEPIDLENLTIFTVGSYGRLEASPHSDIDLFFVYTKTPEQRRTSEIRLFGRLIEKVEELEFPPLSNDAEYLKSHESEDVLQHLGSSLDDFHNYFTTRMLLLLESRCLYGEKSYKNVVNDILESYQRDYPSHEDNFRPWFLLNDIMRFWKTLLLNYENKRNRGDVDRTTKQRVRNFKLKFSRATTCFATICAVGSIQGHVGIEDLKTIVSSTPRERLLRVADQLPQLERKVDEILAEYAWFLEQTALPTEELEAKFSDPSDRREMFKRASEYGELLFGLLQGIDDATDNSLLRALVV